MARASRNKRPPQGPSRIRKPKKRPAKVIDPGRWGSKIERDRDRVLVKEGYYFDVAAADRATQFIELFLVHSKGQCGGQPFILEAWQRRFVRRLFGWKRPGGVRRYRKAYLLIPRKNGKTTLAAAIALFLTIGDREKQAEVYSAANDKEQARQAFKEACAMVRKSPWLMELVTVYKTAIIVTETLSSYQALSSESGNKDGLNVHGLVIDELHEWEDRELWEKLTTAMGSRAQPMTVICTTAGWDPNSLWAEVDDHAHAVASGAVIDDALLPVIFEAKPTDDWKLESTWRKANPNYGTALNPSIVREDFQEAMLKPAFENAFKRYHLNIRTEQATRWMPMERWDECGKIPVDPQAYLGERCWIGLDLSRRNDITAAVKLFKDHDKLVLVPRFYIPAAGLEDRERRDHVPYREWIKQGFVIATAGDVIDYSFIRADLLVDAERYEIVEVAYDPYGATQLALQLQDDGINCVEFGQSIKFMSEPTKGLLLDVLSNKLVHGGNPVLRWMAANANAIADANDNVKLVKNKSAGRIDGIVAAIMARARATLVEDSTSVYESGGLKTL